MFFKRRHHLRHLGEDVGRAARSSSRSPMRLAISWMIHRSCRASPGGLITSRASCTRRSVLVKVPDLFREGRGRQDHVGMERGLGEEHVLHHEVLELGQRLARMLQVGVRHRGVLALDVHAA